MTDELDALRRRLYAPDVTAEEVERYRALVGEPEPQAPAAPGEAAAAAAGPRETGGAASPRRRRTLLVGLAAAAVLALAGIGVAATSRSHPRPQTTPSPSLAAGASSFDDSTIAVPASVRSSFVAALQAGRAAGVLHYLYEHPEALPAQLRTVGRADSSERSGSDTAVLVLSPSPAAQKGGRLTVAVTLDRAAGVQLRAIRADSGMRSFLERLDDGATRAIPGLPMVRTVVYDGEAPTVLVLTVPNGVRWDVVTDFTD
ncbi:MAG TPA: hypothetical protein VGO26_09765 [Amnibacterium sp.]|nr:hypothetical protein [Amnibacterium sp.]